MTLEELQSIIARVLDVSPESLRYNLKEFSLSVGSLDKLSLNENVVEETFHQLDAFVFEYHLGKPMRAALISAVCLHLGGRLRQKEGNS